MVDIRQTAFTRGEVSPSVRARVDLDIYREALQTCLNFIPRPYGGIENRPGFEYVAEVKDSTKATRVVPFEFNADQTYIVELGNAYARFVKNGGQLTSGGSPVEITTPYTSSEVFDIHFTQSADVMYMAHPKSYQRVLTRVSDTSWTMAPYKTTDGPFEDMNTDDSKKVWVDSPTGSITIHASASIFESDHQGALMYLEPQNLTDVPPWEPNRRIAAPGENVKGTRVRYGGRVYECVSDYTVPATGSGGVEARTGRVPLTHEKGTANDGQGTAVYFNGSLVANKAGFKWKYIHSGFGIVQIDTVTSGSEVEAKVLTRIPDGLVNTGSTGATDRGSFSGDGSTKTFSLSGASSADEDDWEVTSTVTVTIYEDGAPGDTFESTFTYDSSEFTINTTSNEITFDNAPSSDEEIDVDEYLTATPETSSFWAFGSWSNKNGYPSTVGFYGNRLSFGNTPAEPQTSWMSRVNDYTSHKQSIPLQPDDAIQFTIASRKINEITNLVALENMILLTSGGEWRLSAGDSEIVAPSTINLKPQSYEGASSLQAEVVGNSAFFVQSQNTRIKSLRYNFEVRGYQSDDLLVLADHLLEHNTVSDLAYQRTPYPTLWVVRDDGTMLSLTIENQANTLAWARHTTDGEFESVAVVPETDEDALYVVVKRTVNGATKRFIERKASRRWTDVVDGVFLDSSISYDGRNTSADTMTVSGGTNWDGDEDLTMTASAATFASSNVGDWIVLREAGNEVRFDIVGYTSSTQVTVRTLDGVVPSSMRGTATSDWTLAQDTMSGLDHLEGEDVTVLRDGYVDGPFTVSSGQITLTQPGGVVHAGLPYNCDAETLPVTIPGGNSLHGRKQTIPTVAVFVKESRGFKLGPDFDTMRETKRDSFTNYSDAADPTTGVATIRPDSTWNESGQVAIRQENPLPLTILSIEPEVVVGGR